MKNEEWSLRDEMKNFVDLGTLSVNGKILHSSFFILHSSLEMLLDDYILSHIDPESDYLHALYRDTHLRLLYPRMASGHLQGRLLKMLVQMIRPRLVLEIGTYSGYSALCLAEGLEDGARLYTFEVNDEQEDFTRPWLERSPWAGRIDFRIGDALAEVPRLGLTFDLAYIDADKRRYVDYYEMVLACLRPGGYIIADNTLWDGHVLEEHPRPSDLTAAVCRDTSPPATPPVRRPASPLRTPRRCRPLVR